jgi:hypothetical protein
MEIGLTFQISLLYSLIALSDENRPIRATLRMDILDQFSWSQ